MLNIKYNVLIKINKWLFVWKSLLLLLNYFKKSKQNRNITKLKGPEHF